MSIFVKFWGTRGSIPTPAPANRVYGGNTSCVEIRFGETLFICDAGSGVRELGKDIVRREPRPKTLHLFVTHAHWDHIQGFPFFVPAYVGDTEIRVYGKSPEENNPYRLLSGQMSSDYFPVSFKELGAKVIADHFDHGHKQIDGVRVRSFPLNHPGGCTGYLFEKDGKKIVYATDNELEIQPGDKFPDLTYDGPPRRVPQELVELFQGADLLITDAQYEEKLYVARRGWGHSTCLSVTDLAIKAKVKNLALFHHDPESTDRDVDAKVQSCVERASRQNAPITIFAAREGVELKF